MKSFVFTIYNNISESDKEVVRDHMCEYLINKTNDYFGHQSTKYNLKITIEKNMKVIFLDHDGVICLPQQWGGRHKKKENNRKRKNKKIIPRMNLSALMQDLIILIKNV